MHNSSHRTAKHTLLLTHGTQVVIAHPYTFVDYIIFIDLNHVRMQKRNNDEQ